MATRPEMCSEGSSSLDEARAGFSEARLHAIAAREATHFWHAPRLTLLLDCIRATGLPPQARVIDVGCGSGRMVEALLNSGFDAHGVDPWSRERPIGNERFALGQVESIPWPSNSVDAACAFDVLEHADDIAGLEELCRVLKPGGKLVLSVPAHSFLWSTRDELAGHRRRYSRRMVSSRVRQAGFRVDQLFGYQCLLLPLLVASRVLARKVNARDTDLEDVPSTMINALLRACNQFEVRLGRFVRPPTGSSLVLSATKGLS